MTSSCVTQHTGKHTENLCNQQSRATNDIQLTFPDSKVRGPNMGPNWVLSAPDGTHDGPMNLAIKVVTAIAAEALEK